MKASLIYRTRLRYLDGMIEAVVWQVPQPVPPSTHPYKYRLVYVVDGVRVVGYDNERGKGDHKHLRDAQLPYVFIDPQQLMVDFMADVEGIYHE